MSANSWFKVDRAGLRKLVEGRSKAAVLYELVQNAWDAEGSTRVDVEVSKLPGRPAARILVRDDSPTGFHDLSHAYTLFAQSLKTVDPTKRGRFNLGEKLVIAMCDYAIVRSTTGTITFTEDGDRTEQPRKRLEKGSEFEAELRMNAQEYQEFLDAFWQLIPPLGIETRLNGELLKRPEMVTEFEVQLPTVVADAEGILRPTKRYTHVEVFHVAEGDTASIYEMGIPVVETGDRYHVSIGQKVPLNMDRDNVSPAYLRTVRAAVLNHTATMLSRAEASESWVSNALEAREVSSDAVVAAVTARYGEQRAVYDPSDREANLNLTGAGYAVIAGSAFSKAAWENVRAAGAALPAGQIAPTPRPYSNDPDAEKTKVIPREEWSQGMLEVEDIVLWAANLLRVHEHLPVRYVRSVNEKWMACFSKRQGIDWNLSVRDVRWFDTWFKHPIEVIDTIIHELAHNETSNHLEHKFHEACSRMGTELLIAVARGAKIPHFEKCGGV